MSMIKPKGGSVPKCPAFLDSAVQHLFPAHRESQGTGLTTGDDVVEPPEVAKVEVQTATKRNSVRKAPGPDGIPGLAIKPQR